MQTYHPGMEYKTCPACQQPAVMNMTRCGRCGFAYTSRSFSARQSVTLVSAIVAAGLILALSRWAVALYFQPFIGDWIRQDGIKNISLHADRSMSEGSGVAPSRGRWYTSGNLLVLVHKDVSGNDGWREKLEWRMSDDGTRLLLKDDHDITYEYSRYCPNLR